MPFDKPRILLVDDEKDILYVLQKGLELKGFHVDGFADPIEAAAQFAPFRYDIVISDIRMPQMTGFDLYRMLRKQDNRFKIFFLTAFEVHEQEVKLAFPNLPLNSFIHKPIGIDDLVRLIETPKQRQ